MEAAFMNHNLAWVHSPEAEGPGARKILCIQSYQQKYQKNLFESAATY